MNWPGGGSKQARTWCGCGIPAHSAAGFGHPLFCWLQGWRARRSPCCGALLDLSSGRYVGTLRPNMRPGQPAVRRQQAEAQAQPAEAQPGPSDGQHPCSPLQLLQGYFAGVNCGPLSHSSFSAEMYCSVVQFEGLVFFLQNKSPCRATTNQAASRDICAFFMGTLLHCRHAPVGRPPSGGGGGLPWRAASFFVRMWCNFGEIQAQSVLADGVNC